MRGAMELCHAVTLAQIAGSHGEARSAEEREAIEGWAKGLTAGQLHRLWQLLLKGHDEVRTAPDPLVAAQMALLRVMHAADLPDPEKLARRLEELASRPAPPAPSASTSAAAVSRPAREMVVLVAMMPWRPSSSARSATASTSSSFRSGAILTSTAGLRREPRATACTAAKIGRSFSTDCRLRSPGVLGELTLTTR